MEEVLHIKRGEAFDYPIVWTSDFTALADYIRQSGNTARKVCIVSDSHVAPLYGQAVMDALTPAYEVSLYVFPAGEANKNLDTIRQLYAFLIEGKYTRKDLLIALGGGVCGDMTGFTAATYLRGIDYVQIPTTLLAQVDSSVGGKTGVDFDAYKNMVGAFWQPRLVYMNTAVLNTLPAEQFAAGMGEVLKTGLIRDGSFYQWLAENRHQIISRDPEAIIHMVKTCCQIKAAVVEEDPYEAGLRAILNFGHTVGHAVEKLKNFTMLHGHCVAAGTIAAGALCVRRGLIKPSDLAFMKELNRVYDLPVSVTGLDAEEILETMMHDKKAASGKLKFILLKQLGEAFIVDDLTREEMLSAIHSILEN